MCKCEVEGCDKKHHAGGYCVRHYCRFKRHGDPGLVKEMHGLSKTTEYRIWKSLKARCYNKNSSNFERYGGRGIKICNKWKHSFSAFHKDMGNKPFPKAQIDRIDNNGNYEPGNCRWVSGTDNMRNTSRTKFTIQKANKVRRQFKAGGITIKELSIEYNVGYSIIYTIVNNKSWIDTPESA